MNNLSEFFGMFPTLEVDQVAEGREERVDVEGKHPWVGNLLLDKPDSLVEVYPTNLDGSVKRTGFGMAYNGL